MCSRGVGKAGEWIACSDWWSAYARLDGGELVARVAAADAADGAHARLAQVLPEPHDLLGRLLGELAARLHDHRVRRVRRPLLRRRARRTPTRCTSSSVISFTCVRVYLLAHSAGIA